MLDFNYPNVLVMTSILIFDGHLYLCGVQLGVDLGIDTKLTCIIAGKRPTWKLIIGPLAHWILDNRRSDVFACT